LTDFKPTTFQQAFERISALEAMLGITPDSANIPQGANTQEGIRLGLDDLPIKDLREAVLLDQPVDPVESLLPASVVASLLADDIPQSKMAGQYIRYLEDNTNFPGVGVPGSWTDFSIRDETRTTLLLAWCVGYANASSDSHQMDWQIYDATRTTQQGSNYSRIVSMPNDTGWLHFPVMPLPILLNGAAGDTLPVGTYSIRGDPSANLGIDQHHCHYLIIDL
jgi:hypothetical protein